jgi:transcriptional regulator with XRE-family HTH domain
MSPSETVPIRIRELREQHGWSQADLTRRMNQLGAGLDRSQVARVEQGERGIPVDELVRYALALNTSLVGLLFPPADDDLVHLETEDADVQIEATAKEARAWARGELPLWPFQDPRRYVLSSPPSELQAD